MEEQLTKKKKNGQVSVCGSTHLKLKRAAAGRGISVSKLVDLAVAGVPDVRNRTLIDVLAPEPNGVLDR